MTLNFMQEKKEADFRYGLVRVRENAESIAFYGGEESEMQLLLQRFKSAFENLTVRYFFVFTFFFLLKLLLKTLVPFIVATLGAFVVVSSTILVLGVKGCVETPCGIEI